MQFNDDFRNKTQQLAIEVIIWYHQVPRKDEVVWILGKQLIRSITSMAANFRAACRARSAKEYYAKLCIVVEENDEAVFWMECFEALPWIETQHLEPLHQRTQEILRVMASTKKRAEQKL